jgi:DNA-binding NarL/FixJ family response regulator
MSDDPPIRVMLVDDHAILRTGVRSFLQLYPDIAVVAEASNGEEALVKVGEVQPEIVLLDIGMPGMNGLVLAGLLRERHAGVKILVLTQHDNPEYLQELLHTGVDAYVLKQSEGEELVWAIRAVHEGKKFLDPQVTATVLATYREKPAETAVMDPWDTLTGRERQVLILLAQGKTVREIAEDLVLSRNTVDFHRSVVFRKMGFHARADLIKYALRRGLLT